MITGDVVDWPPADDQQPYLIRMMSADVASRQPLGGDLECLESSCHHMCERLQDNMSIGIRMAGNAAMMACFMLYRKDGPHNSGRSLKDCWRAKVGKRPNPMRGSIG